MCMVKVNKISLFHGLSKNKILKKYDRLRSKDTSSKNDAFYKLNFSELTTTAAYNKFKDKYSKNKLSGKQKNAYTEQIIEQCSKNGILNTKLLSEVDELATLSKLGCDFEICNLLGDLKQDNILSHKNIKKISEFIKESKIDNPNDINKILLSLGKNIIKNPEITKSLYNKDTLKYFNPYNGVFIPKSKQAAIKLHNEIIKHIKTDTKYEFIINNIDKNLCNILYHTKNGVTFIGFDKNGNKAVKVIQKLLSDGRLVMFENNYHQNKKIISKFNNRKLEKQITKIYDKNNKLKKTEILTMSPINGNFDIIYKYPDGKIEIAARAFKDPTSNEQIIKHNFISNDGTKTKAKYLILQNGDKTSKYQILSPENKVILEENSFNHKINENNYITINNGDYYDIKYKNNNISVNKNGLKVIPHLKINQTDKELDKTLLSAIQELSGQDFVNIKQNGVKEIKLDKKMSQGAYWNRVKKYINLSPEVKDSTFVIKHELGHAKDTNGFYYSENKDFKNTIQKELKNFNKTATYTDKLCLDYFLQEHSGLQEIIAESNALRNTIQDCSRIAHRTIYLERYFPKSIAKAINFLNQA